MSKEEPTTQDTRSAQLTNKGVTTNENRETPVTEGTMNGTSGEDHSPTSPAAGQERGTPLGDLSLREAPETPAIGDPNIVQVSGISIRSPIVKTEDQEVLQGMLGLNLLERPQKYRYGQDFNTFCDRFEQYVRLHGISHAELYLWFLGKLDERTY